MPHTQLDTTRQSDEEQYHKGRKDGKAVNLNNRFYIQLRSNTPKYYDAACIIKGKRLDCNCDAPHYFK